MDALTEARLKELGIKQVLEREPLIERLVNLIQLACNDPEIAEEKENSFRRYVGRLIDNIILCNLGVDESKEMLGDELEKFLIYSRNDWGEFFLQQDLVYVP